MLERKGGHRLGLHRVLDSEPRLPQAAIRLDNSLPIFSNEVLIDVECLNIDAASFIQMENAKGSDIDSIGAEILKNAREQGKQHNRQTGSGGILIGHVKQVGTHYRGICRLQEGDSVATLVSLTLTPLHIDEILNVDLRTHQVQVRGHAILFESGIAAKLPRDLPRRVAMAAFDVAGAPALVRAHVRKGHSVVIIGGGGKAGLLSCMAAREKIGRNGKIFAIEPSKRAALDLKRLRICDAVWETDAKNALEVATRVGRATHGKMGDVVVNVAPVPDTELSAILSCAPKGKAIFFSMATSFSRVALGAEGVASPATLLFGNGFYPGHDRLAIQLLRNSEKLRDIFISRYDQ